MWTAGAAAGEATARTEKAATQVDFRRRKQNKKTNSAEYLPYSGLCVIL
jgi:hypothetical protein